MKLALTREISLRIVDCELTYLERLRIDYVLATLQHTAYEASLRSLGYLVKRLPAGSEIPDSVFIEDIALVLPELAVITLPGAVSRRAEIPAVAQALKPYRPQVYIESPATLDGGDVLLIGKNLWIGISGRSNFEAVAQLQNNLGDLGYSVRGVEVRGCLHLKSAVTQVGMDTLLANPDWVDPAVFGQKQVIEVDPTEPHAANALLLDGCVVYPSGYPKTCLRLEQAGIQILNVDVSELAKAEGGVTCCSLIFDG